MRNFLLLVIICCSPIGFLAQTPSPTPSPKPEKDFIKHIVEDQKAIWTSPFHLKSKDLKWIVPFAVGAGGLFAGDRETSSWVSTGGSLPSASRYASWGGTGYATAGLAGALYFAGRATGNYRARETGVLAAEALIDSGIVTSVVKYSVGRERPSAGLGKGRFFVGGQSFPSGHSTAIWSVATVIANEYDDKPLVKYGAYTGAVLVSVSRYSGRNHFLSDILIGGTIGYLNGRFVYNKRHYESASSTKRQSSAIHWLPNLAPKYERRTRTVGAKLVWNL